MTAAHDGAARSHWSIMGITGEASANGVTKQWRQIIEREKRSAQNGAVQQQVFIFLHLFAGFESDAAKRLCSLAEVSTEKVNRGLFFFPRFPVCDGDFKCDIE